MWKAPKPNLLAFSKFSLAHWQTTETSSSQYGGQGWVDYFAVITMLGNEVDYFCDFSNFSVSINSMWSWESLLFLTPPAGMSMALKFSKYRLPIFFTVFIDILSCWERNVYVVGIYPVNQSPSSHIILSMTTIFISWLNGLPAMFFQDCLLYHWMSPFGISS